MRRNSKKRETLADLILTNMASSTIQLITKVFSSFFKCCLLMDERKNDSYSLCKGAVWLTDISSDDWWCRPSIISLSRQCGHTQTCKHSSDTKLIQLTDHVLPYNNQWRGSGRGLCACGKTKVPASSNHTNANMWVAQWLGSEGRGLNLMYLRLFPSIVQKYACQMNWRLKFACRCDMSQ